MRKNSWLIAVVVAIAGCGEAAGARPTGYQGVLEFEERDLAFEVGGRVKTLAVHRGQTLTAGTTVATLDDTMARPGRAARAAELEAARARLSLLRAGARPSDLRSLQAQITGARATENMLSRNLTRARSLAASGSAPGSAADDLEGQYDRARAERASLEERLQTMRLGARPQEIATARAQIEAATQAVALEDQRLSRYALRSDAEGAVIDLTVEEGDVVAPGATVAVVADTGHPYVDVFVPQRRIDGVRVDARATVRVDATRETFTGRVEDVGRQTEFTPRYLFSEQERPNLVLRVRVRVDDPRRRLHAGVPAFVSIEGAGP